MAYRLKYILFLLLFYSINLNSRFLPGNDLILREQVSVYGQARIRVPLKGSRQLEYLSRNLSVSAVKRKDIEIVISPLTLEWFISQKVFYEIIDAPVRKSLLTSSNVGQAMEWESYPTYTQYDSIMQSFPLLYPSLCDIDTIGTSINGRHILVLKISDNVTADEDEPAVFYTSSIHGDETAGFILMLRLADYLLKNYSTNSRVRNIIDNLEIWINPLSNPDGTYRNGDAIIAPTRFNANGYDLNRNFPDPATPGTVKQKETIDMVKFLREKRFVLSVNFHSGAEVVNFPWDSRWRAHADYDWFYDISRKYADTVHSYSPPGYMTFLDNGVTNGYEWYSIKGGRQDFVTWELQGREVTIELHDEYITPASQLNLLWERNYRSLLGYMENALYGIHGTVKDSETGFPVVARVFINDHDKDSSHVYSDTLTGSFIRMLAPGTYNLGFRAKGYADKDIKGVVVEKEVKTSLDVEMIPFVNPVDTANTPALIIYPNPSSQYLTLILPDRQYGKITVTIYKSSGLKIADFKAGAEKNIPLRIDVSGMEEGVYILQVRNNFTGMTDRTRFVVAGR